MKSEFKEEKSLEDNYSGIMAQYFQRKIKEESKTKKEKR